MESITDLLGSAQLGDLLLILLLGLLTRNTNVVTAARNAAVNAIYATETNAELVKEDVREVVRNGVTERLDEIVTTLNDVQGQVNDVVNRVGELEKRP